MVKIKGDDGF